MREWTASHSDTQLGSVRSQAPGSNRVTPYPYPAPAHGVSLTYSTCESESANSHDNTVEVRSSSPSSNLLEAANEDNLSDSSRRTIVVDAS